MFKRVCLHITFAHEGIAERKKSKLRILLHPICKNLISSCIGLHLSNRSKVEGESSLSDEFTSLSRTVNKVRCYLLFHTFL